jgi:hypothetical protein
MRNSDAHSYGALGCPDRRRLRSAPKARVWPGRQKYYATLDPRRWYPVCVLAPRDAVHIWLRTAHGLTRVHRMDVEVQAVES